MEEVFVPHWQKLWANWKGRHWSIMSIPGMHASDWKDEGPSVNPLGEDGMHASDWKDEASIVHEFVTRTLASRRSWSSVWVAGRQH